MLSIKTLGELRAFLKEYEVPDEVKIGRLHDNVFKPIELDELLVGEEIVIQIIDSSEVFEEVVPEPEPEPEFTRITIPISKDRSWEVIINEGRQDDR